jgi:hypothetical protein
MMQTTYIDADEKSSKEGKWSADKEMKADKEKGTS